MVKLVTVLIALPGLVLPFAHHAKPLTPAMVEQKLLRQMNSGPDGKMTRSVHCRATAKHEFGCSLLSLRGTSLGVQVVVHRRSLQTTFSPLAG